jgi:hypothetical protein
MEVPGKKYRASFGSSPLLLPLLGRILMDGPDENAHGSLTWKEINARPKDEEPNSITHACMVGW